MDNRLPEQHVWMAECGPDGCTRDRYAVFTVEAAAVEFVRQLEGIEVDATGYGESESRWAMVSPWLLYETSTPAVDQWRKLQWMADSLEESTQGD